MPDLTPAHVTVIGIGADGWASLSSAARTRLEQAEVVVGATRQLALLPELDGQERRAWPSPFSYHFLQEYSGRAIVVLASGDPMVSGIGSTLAAVLDRARLEVLPSVSSVALARARMLWDAERTEVVTVVGRQEELVLSHLAPQRRLLVLSSDETTPSILAGLLVDVGYGASRLTVLGDLGSDTESSTDGTAATWDARSPHLNIVAIECQGPVIGAWTAGLPDDAFEHDGQLTKRDLRASALARLAPQPGQLLLDLGAGAGSVAIEWMRAHPTCSAYAVERDPERATRIRRNATRLGVPGLWIEQAESGAALEDLLAPHAIFVGGGATAAGLLDRCRAKLLPGGRLVVHGVTLETEQLLATAYAQHGGELTRIAVETAAPIGSFTGWTPARAVTQWAWSKP